MIDILKLLIGQLNNINKICLVYNENKIK